MRRDRESIDLKRVGDNWRVMDKNIERFRKEKFYRSFELTGCSVTLISHQDDKSMISNGT